MSDTPDVLMLDQLRKNPRNHQILPDSTSDAGVWPLADQIFADGFVKNLVEVAPQDDEGLHLVLNGYRRVRAVELLCEKHPDDPRWQAVPIRILSDVADPEQYILDCLVGERHTTLVEKALVYGAWYDKLKAARTPDSEQPTPKLKKLAMERARLPFKAPSVADRLLAIAREGSDTLKKLVNEGGSIESAFNSLKGKADKPEKAAKRPSKPLSEPPEVATPPAAETSEKAPETPEQRAERFFPRHGLAFEQDKADMLVEIFTKGAPNLQKEVEFGLETIEDGYARLMGSPLDDGHKPFMEEDALGDDWSNPKPIAGIEAARKLIEEKTGKKGFEARVEAVADTDPPSILATSAPPEDEPSEEDEQIDIDAVLSDAEAIDTTVIDLTVNDGREDVVESPPMTLQQLHEAYKVALEAAVAQDPDQAWGYARTLLDDLLTTVPGESTAMRHLKRFRQALFQLEASEVRRVYKEEFVPEVRDIQAGIKALSD